MPLDDYSKKFFESYMAEEDNIFAAINEYSSNARKLRSSYQNRISDAESLDSVLDGKLPDNLDDRKLIANVEFNYITSYIDSVLADIDDKNIKESVKRSLNESIFSKNLKYLYTEDLSESEKSRVRIICKMVWSNLFIKEDKRHAAEFR